MIIKKLNTVFHKHSRVLFGAFTLVIIVSFLGFLTPGQFGCGDMSLGAPEVGTAFGKKVTTADLQESGRRLSIFSEAFLGQRTEFDPEQLFFFHCAEVKAGQLGIHASPREISEAISSMPMLQTDGKFDKRKYRDLVAALRRNGITEDELLDAMRGRIVMDKLQQQLFGNVIVTASEVETFFRTYNTRYLVAVAGYTADSVRTAPTAAQLETFFKANRNLYRIEGRVSALLAEVPYSAFRAEARKEATAENLEKFYRDNTVLFTGKDGKPDSFEQCRSEVLKRFVEAGAAELAKRKAYDFASGVYEEMSEVAAADRSRVFSGAAAKAGIRVLPAAEAAFSGDSIGKVKSREVVRELIAAAESNPVTDAVPLHDAVYVGCVLTRTETRPAELGEVKAQVEQDWRRDAARRMAFEEAGKLNAITDAAERIKVFRALKNVKFSDFEFTKWGRPSPPAGFESALQLTELPEGRMMAVPDASGAALFCLLKRTPPDIKDFEAEKERCTMMCRALKQSVAASEFSEDIAANCVFTMKPESAGAAAE